MQWSEKDGICFLRWTEIDGPTIAAPTRTGFGSRMMRASLETIEGTIDPEFNEHGYSCEIKFAIQKLNLAEVEAEPTEVALQVGSGNQ